MPVLASASMGGSRPTVGHLRDLKRRIKASPDIATQMEAIAEVMHIGFDDANRPRILQEAYSMLYRGRSFSPGLINVFQHWNNQILPEVTAPLREMNTEELDETAANALKDVRGALESQDHYLISATMMRAAYSIYAVAQSGGQDRRRNIDELIVANYSPLTIFPASMVVNEAGLMVFWDRFERFKIFEALFSENPNRSRFANPRLALLAGAERASGTKGTTVQEIFNSWGSPEKLHELEYICCPEKYVSNAGISDMIFTICGAAMFTMEPTIQERFMADLIDVISNKVHEMSLLELGDMFMAEGGGFLEGGVPLKLVVQMALDRIDQLVADKNLDIENAGDTVDSLKMIVSLCSKLLSELRNVPEGYLDFDNPYAFTSKPPKGSH